IWLSIAEVRERVVASGSLTPADSVQLVEHLEGGIVESVQVREGEIVKAGAVLMQLRPEATRSDLQQLKIRAAVLELEQIRIDATLAGVEPDFGAIGAEFPELAADQARLYASDRVRIDETQATMKARIARSKASLASLSAQREAFEKRMEILSEQATMREQLLQEGFSSRREYLEARYRVEDVNQEMIANAGDVESARRTLDEARSQLAQSDAETANRLAEERKEAARELAEIRQQMAKQTDRAARLDIRAPIDAIVFDLAVGNVGEVVNPGDVIARVVPVGADIVAEVRVRPQDVAQIRPGQEAEITVTAFDPNVFGTVAGKVRVVSPSTFEDEQGAPYYKASIAIAQQALQGEPGALALLPGMVVEASIVTGSKSIMRYLLKPVYRSLDRAFTEK
ncbi:MAG: HlyD family type I secretion periplasmic adaptor subunit, partial [Rhizobiales bacterium]|nr:HlyD family type I secretion periplasmic adaptor subunit [Hyphomicrobiales bacterium]